MRYNALGRSGLQVSQLGCGAGSTGGVLIRGAYPEMVRIVARAIELGVNYFDTAAYYGAGQSEVNLGAVLRELGADVLVGSKARPVGEDQNRLAPAILRSVEGSLRRLGRDYIDLIQLHVSIALERTGERNALAVRDLPEVYEAFETLRRQGKVRAFGLTHLLAGPALSRAADLGLFHSAQVPFSLLNPSAGFGVAPGFPFPDYGQVIDEAADKGLSTLAIRVMAGGALSGVVERHPLASPAVDGIASMETEYAAAVARAQRFRFLVEEGAARTMPEAAVRLAVSRPGVACALVGVSSIEQLEEAVHAVEQGPLPEPALRRAVQAAGAP